MEYKLETQKKIEINNDLYEVETNLPRPVIEYGFHGYYNDVVKRLIESEYNKDKTRPYRVLSKCNNTINEYDKDIRSEFKKKYKKEITSQDYYKIYEVIKEYKIPMKDVLIADDHTGELIKIIGGTVKELSLKSLEKSKYKTMILRDHIKFGIAQEQEFLRTLLTYLKIITHIEENGTVVMKVYNLFLNPEIQAIEVLTGLFKEVSIYIPSTEEEYKNEKYIICKGYKENKEITKLIDKIILKENEYVTDLGVKVSQKTKDIIKKMNVELLVRQAEVCNLVMKYIKENNYYGTEYNRYRDIQIEESKKWISKYLK